MGFLRRAARTVIGSNALSGNINVDLLAKLAKNVGARVAAISDPGRLADLKDALGRRAPESAQAKALSSKQLSRPADWVWRQSSARPGLKPALAAVYRGATVGLANKECLFCAVRFFHHAARGKGAGPSFCPPIL